MSDPKKKYLAARCGLYCGCCSQNLVSHECHGCGCTCGECLAVQCSKECQIFPCTIQKNLNSCAACDDFPCTRLIQFAVDPIWRTHLPVLENLRRIQKIGEEAWLAEQAAYWSDERRLARWLELHLRCIQNYNKSETRR